MNKMELDDKGEDAKLAYLDGEYEVMVPGAYVVCAVTGTQHSAGCPALLERGFAGSRCQPRCRHGADPAKGLVPK